MACQIISLGATLTHLWVPDNKNTTRDVVLGFDDLTAYRTKHDPYFGASVGRTANRIAQGQFSVPDNPDVVYKLDRNNGPNSLHGGIDGFSFRNWDVEIPAEAETSGKTGVTGTSLRLSMVSNHMDQGFPGRLHVQCTYRLLNSAIEIAYEAYLDSHASQESQQLTIVSLTNHAYFNLNGVPTLESTNNTSTPRVTNHVMEMFGIDSYLETDDTSIPTGTVLPLDEIPAMDFRKPKKIGDNLTQTPGGGLGYDHFYPVKIAINEPNKFHLPNDIRRIIPTTMVKVYSPESGIHMAMATTEPGFQLYTANFVQLEPNQIDVHAGNNDNVVANPLQVGKARGGYAPHSGFCLEASKFPDAINHPTWRDQVILRQGDKYQSRTTFTFSTN
ncbi:galactose mutarotase-like domain-containing protein [Dissophora ornata]|nr:galactose mutarotase-like domain-containing protein [Dissophora ornata]